MDRPADNGHQLEQEMLASEALLALADGVPVDAQNLDTSSLPSATTDVRKRPLHSNDIHGMTGPQDIDGVTGGQDHQASDALTSAAEQLAADSLDPPTQPHAAANMGGPELGAAMGASDAADTSSLGYSDTSFLSDDEESQVELPLLEAIAAAQGWAVDLITRFCDAESRNMLFETNKECQELMLQTATQATITILVYNGLSEAGWRRRLKRAEQGLFTREQLQPGGSNKLMLKQDFETGLQLLRLQKFDAVGGPATALGVDQPDRPAMSFEEALQALLSIAPAAGKLVGELEIDQRWYQTYTGVETPWLAAMPAAFPNVRVLRINELYGCMPIPTTLPHLTELYVRLSNVGYEIRYNEADYQAYVDQLSSLSRYLPQLTALKVDIMGGWMFRYEELELPTLLFDTVAPKLTRYITNLHLEPEDLEILREQAPALVRLECGAMPWDPCEGEWSVRELVSELGVKVSYLPLSPQGLTLLPMNSYLRCSIHVASHEGLSAADLERLGQLRFAKDCTMSLELERLQDQPDAEIRAGVMAAVRQLAPHLPEGSDIELEAYSKMQPRVRCAACGALAAVAASVPHLKMLHDAKPLVVRSSVAAV